MVCSFRKAFLGALALAVFPWTAKAVPKKLIAFGWEFNGIKPADVLANADKFADTPIDGIGIKLQGTNSFGECFASNWDPHLVHGPRWDRNGIRRSVEEWREVREKTTLKHCFVMCFRQPMRRLSWTDDTAWEKFANNIAVAAWAARETGFKGVFCDPEDYHGQRQFYWRDSDPPLEECRKLVRKRGAECFGGAFRECPDLTVFFFWLLSQSRGDFSTSALAQQEVNSAWLWPDFVDGILDVITAEAKLVDGDEWAYSYSYKTRDFHEGALNQVHHARRFLSPENRVKYAAHISPSFGIYLDRYVFSYGWWHAGPVAGSRLEHLRRNVSDAVECAGEYVWLWGECRMWIDWTKDVKINDGVFTGRAGLKNRKPGEPWRWEDWIPGINKTLVQTKDFNAGCVARMEELRAGGVLTNLIAYGHCRFPDRAKHVKGFQKYVSGGIGILEVDKTVGCGDSTSIRIEGARYAQVEFARDREQIDPGEVYAFAVSVKGEDTGLLNAFVGYRNYGDTPLVEMKFGEEDGSGWRHGMAFFKVPLSLNRLRVCVSVRQNCDAAKKVWLDNFALYRLWPQ